MSKKLSQISNLELINLIEQYECWAWPNEARFFKKLKSYYEEKKTLTHKQRECLIKTALKLINRKDARVNFGTYKRDTYRKTSF